MGDVGDELIGRLKELSGGVDARGDDKAIRRHFQRFCEYAHEMAYGASRHLCKLLKRYLLRIVLLDVGDSVFEPTLPFRHRVVRGDDTVQAHRADDFVSAVLHREYARYHEARRSVGNARFYSVYDRLLHFLHF